MDSKDQVKFEQGAAFLADSLPPFWKRMYEAAKDSGFSDDQAFRLVQTQILAQCPNGINGT